MSKVLRRFLVNTKKWRLLMPAEKIFVGFIPSNAVNCHGLNKHSRLFISAPGNQSETIKIRLSESLFINAYKGNLDFKITLIQNKSAELEIGRPGIAGNQVLKYPLTLSQAKTLLSGYKDKTIKKERYQTNYGGQNWIIDRYLDQGITIASTETANPNSRLARPVWLSREVTSSTQYEDRNLWFRKSHKAKPSSSFGSVPRLSP